MLAKAKAYAKEAPKAAPGYKVNAIGVAGMDTRGALWLDDFTTLCLEGVKAQRDAEAAALDAIFTTWMSEGEDTYSCFFDMVKDAVRRMHPARLRRVRLADIQGPWPRESQVTASHHVRRPLIWKTASSSSCSKRRRHPLTTTTRRACATSTKSSSLAFGTTCTGSM